ncbi:MAG: hypothetical protein ACJAW7_002599 [Candidatus Azotimanducaceae bacterium]|jgi:hypothetical protein
MMEFEPALAFVKNEIEREIQGRPMVPEGFLIEFVQTRSGLAGMMDDQLKEKLVKYLETYFWTESTNGHSLSIGFDSWYPDRKTDDGFSSYYWARLNKYWYDYSVIPRNAVRSTDDVTDEIMDYLGDPQNQDSWLRRGLVMGHVQSGKTTNYSALVTKAADAGYRIIIVLAGLTNSLRKQTQERLDQSFVGKSSLGDALNNQFYPVSRVMSGVQGYVLRSPFCGTTQIKDFNVGTLRGIGALEGNFAEPILFVTKKHVGVLERLASWLGSLKEGGQLDGPMLVIDDEADNASVNTTDSDSSVTRTNERIRQLLRCSRRASYVGYTATPFANIFIHPDSNNEMLGDNLFPEHFIKSLDPPDNYVGAKDLFLEGGRYNNICVHKVPDDYQDILPLKHKSDHALVELPPSLVATLYQYFLFRAIRHLDNEIDSHSSMMINVSRFNRIQAIVFDLVEDEKKQVADHVNVWAKSTRWQKSEVLQRLQSIWNAEYDDLVDHTWDDVRNILALAIEPISTALVNMRGSALDYSSKKGKPIHVIAIGGLALARGLTLEGLAVSYVLRNVGAGDTLLQLGRWFGYRPGYENLCRVYLTEDMISHFEHVSDSIEELRDDLVRMEKLGRTPGEFGLKVRESPTGIAITAANKMRSAETVLLAADYREKHVQAYEIYDDNQKNSNHMTAVLSLHEKLLDRYGDSYDETNGALVWRGVPSSLVVTLLSELDLPQIDFSIMNNGSSLLIDYISDRAVHDRQSDMWTIAIPYTREAQTTGRERLPFPIPLQNSGKAVYCRQRLTGSGMDKSVKITDKNVVADLPRTDLTHGEDRVILEKSLVALRNKNPEERITDARGYLNCRKESILLIHLFQFKLSAGNANLDNSVPVVSVSVGLTATEFNPKERLYKASVRMIEQLSVITLNVKDDDDVVTDGD